MARKPRIHYPGAVYHVILRGNAGQPIFFDERDRYRFYLFMQYVVEKFACRIHGFCCMTNHSHLVIQTSDIPLSQIMQNLSLRYTKWINYTQSRTGHVFQGRYKALLLDADAYLLELVRYIHLNPVRAQMTASPDDYPWSGHRSYLGKEVLPWLTTDLVLSMFSSDIKKARRDYASFVAEGIGDARRDEFHSGTFEGRILGDDIFTDEALRRANQPQVLDYSLSDLLDVVCRRFGITEEQLKFPGKARPYAEARALIALFVLEMPGLSLTELGRMLNRDIASLGRAGRRLLKQALENEEVNSRLNELRQELLK
jgi:REP element-mobilizing transposase RayT